jgi:hypothetical protein
MLFKPLQDSNVRESESPPAFERDANGWTGQWPLRENGQAGAQQRQQPQPFSISNRFNHGTPVGIDAPEMMAAWSGIEKFPVLFLDLTWTKDQGEEFGAG